MFMGYSVSIFIVELLKFDIMIDNYIFINLLILLNIGLIKLNWFLFVILFFFIYRFL